MRRRGGARGHQHSRRAQIIPSNSFERLRSHMAPRWPPKTPEFASKTNYGMQFVRGNLQTIKKQHPYHATFCAHRYYLNKMHTTTFTGHYYARATIPRCPWWCFPGGSLELKLTFQCAPLSRDSFAHASETSTKVSLVVVPWWFPGP